MSATAAGAAESPRASRWWLDSGIARLAFGTRAARAGKTEATIHLAFLPVEALELDLTDPAQREFGDYELLEQIGQGGMGVVYRARQHSLDREVALKLLAAGPWASEEFIAGFRREARSAAALQHPNIVAIHEMDERDGLIFYSMQLVQGCSLAQRLQGGPLQAREAATILRTVAEAIDYAHRLGVLHLDLKPGNILLDAAGTPMVADFGLARRLGQAPSVENEQVSGTPSYMAPEQAQVGSMRLSAATDLWGLGAILYEALTGTPPFVADSPHAVLHLVLHATVRKLGRHARVPADLEAICLKCLSKTPTQRYASARELADDLGRFLENRSVRARPLNLAQRALRWAAREPRLAIATAVSVLLLSGGLAATTAQWHRAEENAATANMRLWQGRRATAMGLEADGLGWQATPLLLQNARELEYAGNSGASAGDRQRLGLLLGQGATLIDAMLVADSPPLAVAVSEDGSRLALALGDRSVRWYDTGTLEELGRISLRTATSHDGTPRSITWLRFRGNTRLEASMEWYRQYPNPISGDRWDLDLDQATARPAPDLFPGLPWLRSDDGRHAAAYDPVHRELRVYALPGPRLLRTLPFAPDSGVSAWAFQPGSGRIALGDVEGRVSLYSPADGAVQAFPSTRGGPVGWLAFSEDGKWLASGGDDGRVQVFDARTGDALTSHTMEHDFPVRSLGVDLAHRMLMVAGDGRVALWRIPTASGPMAWPPIRIALPPAPHARAGPYAVAWSRRTGLLATAGLDGQVRLWRLPTSPTLPTRQAPQLPERVRFDGHRLLDVAWNRIRVTDLRGNARGPALELAQPPGFAELVGERTLVLTVGPTLEVRDSSTLRLRGPAIPLPDSPSRLLPAPDGHHLLLAFAAATEDGFGERLVLYDVDAARPVGDGVVVPGPLRELGFATDATRLYTIGPDDDATRIYATHPRLHEIGSYVHDPAAPVIAADFAPDPRRLLLLTRGSDPRTGDDALVVREDGHEALRLATGKARPYGVIALGQGAFLPGESANLLFDGQSFREVPRTESRLDAGLGAYAASPDHRTIALASLRSVQLYGADGEPIGLPLRLDTPSSDGIARLAFSADGGRLLVRTVWTAAQWRVAPDPRTDRELDSLLALVQPGGPGTIMPLPDATWRDALRRGDPGAWPELQPLPWPAPVARARLDGAAVPARAPATPDDLLDLGRMYALAPGSIRNSSNSQRPFLRPWPAGVQRLLGTDFDIRGIAEAGPRGLGECVPVPGRAPLAAMHALLVPHVPVATRTATEVGELVFRYRDGGERAVPLRTTREVPGYGGNDHAVPQVLPVGAVRAAMGLGAGTLAAPRIANPEPGRPVRCVDLRSSAGEMLVLALTAEPATPAVTSAAHFR